ncbi:hypothetical protein E3T54_13635 [Cryobacterium sp. Sr8]|uniref:hypothetical protein n=1 Tax=Cryobacterium sp. Sr8 TaxID=1259203 RepID=UPI0010695BF7|nr:hypothetical protein [Cryobacterium sp. Sr8]TFD74613.1 hypothetical protein E3T54_13635 [Cryobacterium sp. Sr8]
MARLAQSLIGHEVLVTLATEKAATGTFRTLRKLEDLSTCVVDGFDAPASDWASDFELVKDKSKLESFAGNISEA